MREELISWTWMKQSWRFHECYAKDISIENHLSMSRFSTRGTTFFLLCLFILTLTLCQIIASESIILLYPTYLPSGRTKRDTNNENAESSLFRKKLNFTVHPTLWFVSKTEGFQMRYNYCKTRIFLLEDCSYIWPGSGLIGRYRKCRK